MQTIYLDISNKGVIPAIYAKQGDVSRKFQVVLTDSGLPYVPANGFVFSVWYSGASGEGNYTDIGDKSAFSVNGNKISVELITQMLSVAGEGLLCLVLNGADGSQIASWNISYVVEPIPGATSDQANAYYTAFSRAVENLPYPDVSLSVQGKAADAAATGRALDDKAPAGYGLGGAAVFVTDLNTVINNGFYRWDTAAVNAPFSAANGGGSMFVLQRNENYVHQFAIDDTTENIMAVRSKKGGEFGEWEYVNPQMNLGVEYRTTERWNGKVVYKKAINLGGLPNGVSSIAHNITLQTALSVALTDGGTAINQYRYIDKVWFDRSNVNVITTNGVFANASIIATLAYTKD